MGEMYIGTQKVIGAYLGTQKIRRVYYGTDLVVKELPLYFEAERTPTGGYAYIIIGQSGTPTLNQNFQYSTDLVTWNNVTIGRNIVIPYNGRVYFKGNNPRGVNESGCTFQFKFFGFSDTTKIHAGGNIMSLIDNGNCETFTIPNNYCFQLLFGYELQVSRLSLSTPPELPATTLKKGCYENMFFNCTALNKVPNLPATELKDGCYDRMFSGCTSLQVNDSSGTYNKAWQIPTSGTFTGTAYVQRNMFKDCAGTRASDDFVPTIGQSNTYYTRYNPI